MSRLAAKHVGTRKDWRALATMVLIAAAIGLTLMFAPALAWGSTLMVGTLVGLAVLKGLIAEPLAAKLAEDHLDEAIQASILDALPFRLPATRRRWDPSTSPITRSSVLLDGDVVVDPAGIAFEAARVVLDTQPLPVDHVVVGDEQRSAGTMDALRYRVADFSRHSANLEALLLAQIGCRSGGRTRWVCPRL